MSIALLIFVSPVLRNSILYNLRNQPVKLWWFWTIFELVIELWSLLTKTLIGLHVNLQYDISSLWEQTVAWKFVQILFEQWWSRTSEYYVTDETRLSDS